MWFWSVSWSTNCPVFFSFFLVNQKKFVQSQGIFGQSLIFFGKALIFFFSLVWKLVTLWYQRVTKLQTRLTKKNQRLTKNSLRLDNFFLVDQKKWEKDRTIGWPRDWPKPHGRDYRFLNNWLCSKNWAIFIWWETFDLPSKAIFTIIQYSFYLSAPLQTHWSSWTFQT